MTMEMITKLKAMLSLETDDIVNMILAEGLTCENLKILYQLTEVTHHLPASINTTVTKLQV